ncbi:MAG: diguanylate cyclase domain-containing protein [Phycisphaerae bacterium]
MSMTFLLPWFPILLGAGLGGRLLGHGRGFVLGLICASFWMAFVQASVGGALWTNSLETAMCLAGALAIITVAGWAGETVDRGETSPSRGATAASVPTAPNIAAKPDESLRVIATTIKQFNEWLGQNGHQANPWPGFDEWLRSTLHSCCQATHVRPYRLVPKMNHLVPLQPVESWSDDVELSARKGIVGYVATTGRAYVSGDSIEREFLDQLGQNEAGRLQWCFPIRQGNRRLGIVAVGQLETPPQASRDLLRCMEAIASQCWCMLQASCDNRAATLDDPVSGLSVRRAFLVDAEVALKESYSDGEPVAVAVFALEGLRRLSDVGQWEIAEEIVGACADELRRKVRMDDRIGRFDSERFVILLRRVDSDLAGLIVRQLLERMERVCSDESRWGVAVQVRCGLVGSGVDTPDLRTLLAGALQQCHRARASQSVLASDLAQDEATSGAPA